MPFGISNRVSDLVPSAVYISSSRRLGQLVYVSRACVRRGRTRLYNTQSIDTMMYDQNVKKTAFFWRNSSIPYLECSQPRPDCLNPWSCRSVGPHDEVRHPTSFFFFFFFSGNPQTPQNLPYQVLLGPDRERGRLPQDGSGHVRGVRS